MPPSQTTRELKFFQAINEALDFCLTKDPNVYVMGLGVPDPKGVFGTTLGLQKKFGPNRVMDMPTSENGMTGIAIGSALVGMRPVMVHQRVDFALLALDQIVSQAANWHYMFAGKMRVPLVVRMIVGRGWGQGPQHSQNLQVWFAHIPGLKVVMPATPHDAKGLLIAAIEDDNPVIFIEHRWLHNTYGEVPERIYRVPIGKACIARIGNDITLVATSYAVVEALQAAKLLAKMGVEAEVIDVRTLRPLDETLILESVRKTGRLLVVDTGWKTFGFGAEVLARVTEEAMSALKCPPQRAALPDCPTPATPVLANLCYPQSVHLMAIVRKMLGLSLDESLFQVSTTTRLDVPDASFRGPF